MLSNPPTRQHWPQSGRLRSNIGFRSSTLSLRYQRWFLSHVPRNSCARLRQRMCRRQCQEREVARCLESLNWLAGRRDRSLEHEGTKPGATQVLLKQEVQARVRELVHERCSRASAIPLPLAAFRELPGSQSVCGPDENGNLPNFSTVEPVPLSMIRCLRCCETMVFSPWSNTLH